MPQGIATALESKGLPLGDKKDELMNGKSLLYKAPSQLLFKLSPSSFPYNYL